VVRPRRYKLTRISARQCTESGRQHSQSVSVCSRS